VKLSIDDNHLILSEVDKLEKYQISQLEYYGFVLNDKRLLKNTIDAKLDLHKIIEYCSTEFIALELSEQATAVYNIFLKHRKQVETFFQKARQLKENDINPNEFANFTAFLNKLPRRLKDHQKKSAYHLYQLKNGAIFSVPGSGKTTVVLSVYEKLRQENQCNILVVVGPAACFQPWKNEFVDTLDRVPETIILAGGDRNSRRSEYFKSSLDAYELYLTTFQTAVHDYSELIKFLSQKDIRAFVVIDEAHYMKQVGGAWASALLAVGKVATFRCVLTGTPIPKSYRDVYNLFDFLWEENTPLTLTDKNQIDLWEKKNDLDNAKELLQEKIGPLFYRVRKKDLGLLPPKFHAPTLVKMNNYESQIYRYIKAKILDLSENEYFDNEEILHRLWRGRLIRMRQAISYPRLLQTAVEDYEENLLENSDLQGILLNYDIMEMPGKLQTLLSMVTKLQQEKNKVVIWSNFIGTLELIKSHLNRLNIKSELIYGKTPIRKQDDTEVKAEKTREDIRDEFVNLDSGLDILIANPAACAESISLHKTCFHAIYYDLTYNCAQYIQSLDRIHRVGGSETKEANYYFLQYENSLDQDIKANLERKARKMYDLIEQDYAIYDLDLYIEGDDDVEAYKRIFTAQQ
jgi:SNF2 family DNA or RNA helicase